MKKLRLTSTLTILGLLCILSMQSSAQQAPPNPSVIRINVNLVQVDAVVTDSSGKPVTNLKAEDFELLQDGKPQKITNFEFIRVRDSLRPFDTAVLPMPKTGGPPPPDTVLKQGDIRRTIALVVDDLALAADTVVRIRESLKKWVDLEMQPGDLVAVIRTNAGVGTLQQFTNDKRMLYSAIDKIKYQPGRVGTMSISSLTDPGPIDTSLYDDELEHAYLRMSFASIQYVIRGLRDLPGRKSLILFSESMRLTFLDGPGIVGTAGTTNLTREDNLRKVADEANRSSVVIYAIDPRGVMFTGLTASDAGGQLTSDQLGEAVGQRSQAFIQSQDGLVILPQKTGGLFYTGNDITGNLARAVNDGNGYYLMGYQPEGSTFDDKNAEGRFHSISLRVKRPGLKVRSRTGFFGSPDNRPVPVPQTAAAQIAKALVSPFTTGDLDVRLTTLFSNSDADGSYVKALLHFDARDLKFTEQPDGSQSAEIDIAIVTFDADGKVSANVDKTWRLNYQKAAYEDVLRRGLVYSTAVPMPKAGPFQVRVALRDATSQKLGSASQFVDIPDVKGGRLVLSGIVMTAARQQTPGDASGADSREDIDGTPAVRIFKSGSSVSYAYEILNVRTEGNDKSQLESQIRLYRDGQPVYTTPMAPLNTAGQPNSKRLAVGGRLELTKIPPGNYVMQVVVSDTKRKDKNGMMAQAMDFQVRE
jgi:VWFA-related protein